MRAIVYTRVSTEEQVHGFSLEAQKEKCLRRCEELGVEDTFVFEEAGVSGEVVNRPALMDAIALLQRDPSIRYFVCTDPDRLSRDLTYLLLFTEQIEKHAELIFTDFTRDNTAEGKLFYSIRGAIAEFEKAMIRRRTLAGKLKKAQQHGWTHWPGIYGYNYQDGVVTVNEEEARVVRMIFELGSKHGIVTIRDRLNELGIPAPRSKGKWVKSTIRRILSNESYVTGKTYLRVYDSSGVHLNKFRPEEEKQKRKIRDRSEWVEMEIPPILDRELFEAAQVRLWNARRKSEQNIQYRYLLSGLLRCGVCGRTWHGFSRYNKNRTYRLYYYVCTNKSPGPGPGMPKCPTSFQPMQKIDEAVWNVIEGWLLDDAAIQRFHEEQKQDRNRNKASAEMEVLEARVRDLSQEEDALLERLARERNPRLRQKINDRLDQVAQEVDRISRLLDDLRGKEEQEREVRVDIETVRSIREEFPDPRNMNFEQKYEVIHRLVEEIVITEHEDNITLSIRPVSRSG